MPLNVSIRRGQLMAKGKNRGGGLQLSVLPRASISAIHSATLDILEHTGVCVELPTAREMLRGAGATIDRDVVRFPSFMIDNALRTAPRRVVIGDRNGSEYLLLGSGQTYFTAFADCPLILDPFTRTRRTFTSKDYRQAARVVDACKNIFGATSAADPADYPAQVAAQVAFKNWILNTTKPLVCCAIEAAQMSRVYEMAELIAGDRERLQHAPFVLAAAEPTSPLKLAASITEILLLAASRNLPFVWYSITSAGVTAPNSPAGTLAVANAEVLAGLILHQLERPGAPFIYGMIPGTADLRTNRLAYGSPDLALHLAAATDLAHYYGLPMYSTAGCSDSHSVDQQAVAEATILCMMAQLSGADVIHDVGLMGGGILVSPEMIVLFDEVIEMVRHATRQIEVTPEELPLDLVHEIGPGGTYMAQDHTLANCSRFWHSGLFMRSRGPGLGPDEPEMIRERINSTTRQIIETHEVEDLPPEKLRELEKLEKSWMIR
jgi:trimethylamine---corrinoid protein Co-methyltransferase